MPKRKRDFLAAKAAQNSSDNPKDKDRQIITLIERSQKDLVRALKLAKGFERQKLSRRLRNATSDGATEEVTRIEAEIRAWRDLDLQSLARDYLSRLVSRDRELSSVETIVANAVTPPSSSDDKATNNVTARLYNSNPVKSSVTVINNSLRQGVGLGTRPSKRIHSLSEREPENAPSSPAKFETSPHYPMDKNPPQTSNRLTGEAESEERENQLTHGTTRIPKNVTKFDPQSDTSNSAGGGSLSGIGAKRRGHDYSESASGISLDVEDDMEDAVSDGSGKALRIRENDAYLPSLTMGGYVSGSESGQSDEDRGAAAMLQRRNRRGQRARQQIWEKKYGSRAKHLQKLRDSQGGRDDGWDYRRGAREERPRPQHHLRDTGSATRLFDPMKGATASEPVALAQNRGKSQPKQLADSNVGLHPSWEAARRAKTNMQLGGSTFAGQKLTFN